MHCETMRQRKDLILCCRLSPVKGLSLTTSTPFSICLRVRVTASTIWMLSSSDVQSSLKGGGSTLWSTYISISGVTMLQMAILRGRLSAEQCLVATLLLMQSLLLKHAGYTLDVSIDALYRST